MPQATDRLSKHFTLLEMTTTTSGLANRVDSPQVLASLQVLCTEILEQVRDHYGRPIILKPE